MNEITVPTLSHTQEEWVVEQFIQNGKSTTELVELFREIYPTFGSDVRCKIGEVKFNNRLLFRFKDIRKKHVDRINTGRAERKELKKWVRPVEPVPTDPEAFREYKLKCAQDSLAQINHSLMYDNLSPGDRVRLTESRRQEEENIQSLSQEVAVERSDTLDGSTVQVESWKVHWNPLNLAEELLYFSLTGYHGRGFADGEIQRRVGNGEQIPKAPGLVEDFRQYKLPVGFDIFESQSGETKEAYEEHIRQWNDKIRGYLGGDKKACEEPNYDEYASLEKRYSDDWSDPADSSVPSRSAEVESVDGASEANPASSLVSVPSSNAVSPNQNGYCLTNYENMSIPEGLLADMATELVKVKGRLGTYDVHCPEGCVSPNKKQGAGYIKYVDKETHAAKYLWVRFNCYNAYNPILPHPDFPKPLPLPGLPTKSIPEIGYLAEDDPNEVWGDEFENNDLKAREEAERILGVNAGTTIEEDAEWHKFNQEREANRIAFRERGRSAATWCII